MLALGPVGLNTELSKANGEILTGDEIAAIENALENFSGWRSITSDNILDKSIQLVWQEKEPEILEILESHEIYTIGQLFQLTGPILSSWQLTPEQIEIIKQSWRNQALIWLIM